MGIKMEKDTTEKDTLDLKKNRKEIKLKNRFK